MEDLSLFTEETFTRKIDTNKKFIIIGNNIDGLVNFNFQEYESFKQLTCSLENVLKSIKGIDEWDINIYQVPFNYKIIHRYGYYKLPNPGKHILRHSYMNEPIVKVFIEKDYLVFIGINYHESLRSFNNQRTSDMSFEVRKIKIIK